MEYTLITYCTIINNINLLLRILSPYSLIYCDNFKFQVTYKYIIILSTNITQFIKIMRLTHPPGYFKYMFSGRSDIVEIIV